MKTKRYTIRLTANEHAVLKKLAKADSRSMAGYIIAKLNLNKVEK